MALQYGMENNSSIEYFSKSIKSKGHTPIYKMHRYYARRPHNLFNELIYYYSAPGDVIYDPFSGGGVTLVEGLTLDRRVISSDINPVACFVQEGQVSNVSIDRFSEICVKINAKVNSVVGEYYTTACDTCSKPADIRWTELAYTCDCPSCGVSTSLLDDFKKYNKDGKPINGTYICTNCHNEFKSADVIRKSSVLREIIYRCENCGNRLTKRPSLEDVSKFQHFHDQYDKLITEYNLFIPDNKIPKYWDRQQEDCLHQKGFLKFSDLFTKRNLVTSALYFHFLEEEQSNLSENEHKIVLFTISSLLRYTNSMTFSTESWMDGRPVAWAKHAYWTPNQYVETNPIEYFRNRIKAIASGLKDKHARFELKIPSNTVADVLDRNADYMINLGNSSLLNIPNNSIDLVITDPPYGSNVQYGELTTFWAVWLQEYIDIDVFGWELSEAVVHRKTKKHSYNKSFKEYEILLNNIFSQCFNVLKPNGLLVFTFNNKNMKAWYAVIKAVLDAGFSIDPAGVFYQEQIHAYRDTAHNRFSGTPKGDFIYTFHKGGPQYSYETIDSDFNSYLDKVDQHHSVFIKTHPHNDIDYILKLYSISIPWTIKQIHDGCTINEITNMFNSYKNRLRAFNKAANHE